jgi:His/Glu/Gln/Arg/opine family amino acid ABC transporter permease subunit
MDWSVLWQYRDVLLFSFGVTVFFSIISIAASSLLGIILGCLGTLDSAPLRRAVAAYVELMRNLPVVVKLFFLYFVIGLDALPSGFIALVTHQSGYIADVIASGFRAVPREQAESAYSQGATRPQIFLFVLLPQVLRIALPPLTNQFVEVVKNSAVIMFIGVEELTFETQQIAHDTFRGFEAATGATVLYLAIALGISAGMNALGRRLREI